MRGRGGRSNTHPVAMRPRSLSLSDAGGTGRMGRGPTTWPIAMRAMQVKQNSGVGGGEKEEVISTYSWWTPWHSPKALLLAGTQEAGIRGGEKGTKRSPTCTVAMHPPCKWCRIIAKWEVGKKGAGGGGVLHAKATDSPKLAFPAVAATTAAPLSQIPFYVFIMATSKEKRALASACASAKRHSLCTLNPAHT